MRNQATKDEVTLIDQLRDSSPESRAEMQAALIRLSNDYSWRIISETIKHNIDSLTELICDPKQSAKRSEKEEAYLKAKRYAYKQLLLIPQQLISQLKLQQPTTIQEFDPYKQITKQKESV